MLKNFSRTDPLFSLCGLNCGLCIMYIGKYCPGCGGGEGNQSCSIARCSLNHEGVQYCVLCREYPCEKYDGVEFLDSFIVHRNQKKDLEKMKRIGLEAYQRELHQKMDVLDKLLSEYNDGRRKSFYCLAVNLLELHDLKSVMEEIETEVESNPLEVREKAKIAVKHFEEMAGRRDIHLKLHKKTE
jgi:hypothetical protein